MKKLVFTMVAAVFAACAFAAEGRQFAWPGWKCRDVAVLEEQLALAEAAGYKICLTYMLDFALNGEPATFADACARIESVINERAPAMPANDRITTKKQYALNNGVFWPETVEFCKLHPSSYDFHVGLRDTTEWGWGVVGNCLLTYRYSPAQSLQAVEYLNQQAIALGTDDSEVLELLKKLNRVFSALLVMDQAAWEKVVAQVRTLMETWS